MTMFVNRIAQLTLVALVGALLLNPAGFAALVRAFFSAITGVLRLG